MKKLLITVGLGVLVGASFLAGREISPRPSMAETGVRKVLYAVSPEKPASSSNREELSGSTGVRTVAAERTTGPAEFRVPGRVTVDDNKVYRVSAGVDGWVRDTYDASLGSHVDKDAKLATFYSPDLLAQENSFLVASDRSAVPVKEASRGIEYAATRLRSLGVSDLQIKEFGVSRKMPPSIYIVSPVNGFIVSRDIAKGQRFEKGAEFYRIADLSSVWVIADVPESAARYFHSGAMATITIAGKGTTLRARVANVLPRGDAQSRTMKVRLEVANPGAVLRPEMFVGVELKGSDAARVSVPEEAVLASGRRTRVFVDMGNGQFEGRLVETGDRFDSRVEIIRGLAAGERIAASANFLVDSESRLEGAEASRAEVGLSAPAAAPSGSEMRIADRRTGRDPDATADIVQDASCGMSIHKATAVAAENTLEVNGTTAYFCSKRCKEDFRKKSAGAGGLMAAVANHD